MFALHANLAFLVLGPRLKIRERLSGRFADVLTNLYMAAAVLWRYEVDGRRNEDLPLVNWCLESAFLRVNQAFDGILANYRVPALGWLLAGPVRFCHWLNPLATGPDDHIGRHIVETLQTYPGLRDRLTGPTFVPCDAADPHSVLERAYEVTMQTAAIERRICDAQTTGSLPRELEGEPLRAAAIATNVVNEEEACHLAEAERLRDEAIQVDSFELVWPQQDAPCAAASRELAVEASARPGACIGGKDEARESRKYQPFTS